MPKYISCDLVWSSIKFVKGQRDISTYLSRQNAMQKSSIPAFVILNTAFTASPAVWQHNQGQFLDYGTTIAQPKLVGQGASIEEYASQLYIHNLVDTPWYLCFSDADCSLRYFPLTPLRDVWNIASLYSSSSSLVFESSSSSLSPHFHCLSVFFMLLIFFSPLDISVVDYGGL